MNNNICYIMGAGVYLGERLIPKPGDYVIAADAGLRHLQEIGTTADLVLGDFDSLGCVPDHPNVIKHPTVKDDTDMLLAVKKGLSMGYEKFIILGGLGKRVDHSMANVQILVYLAHKGARGYLIGGGTAITVISNASVSFDSSAKGIISVLCCCDRAVGVNIEGLRYPLHNVIITNDMPIGISNEFIGEPSTISVENGALIIFWNEGLEIVEDLWYTD